MFDAARQVPLNVCDGQMKKEVSCACKERMRKRNGQRKRGSKPVVAAEEEVEAGAEEEDTP